jgi:DNA-binding MarR family transcriptional regulator
MTKLDIQKAELTGIKLMKVFEHLDSGHASLFKDHGLSGPQYNVLRILRGARGEDLNCHEVGDRMLKRVPDVTRLLDRLEQRNLITRWRCSEDRRVVRTRITEDGLQLLAAIDKPLRDRVKQDFRHFDDRKLAQLDRLLGALLPD